jgi:hypothetical protein
MSNTYSTWAATGFLRKMKGFPGPRICFSSCRTTHSVFRRTYATHQWPSRSVLAAVRRQVLGQSANPPLFTREARVDLADLGPTCDRNPSVVVLFSLAMKGQPNQLGLWSGRWESNPRPKLGKLLYCHCTTPALLSASPIIHNQAAARTDPPSAIFSNPPLKNIAHISV